MENQLLKTKYIPLDEADLARHILATVPFAKENIGIFEESWIEYVLDIRLSPEQKARLHNFSLINGNRRRQEIQLDNPQLRPSLPEQRRRTYLARGAHLQSDNIVASPAVRPSG